MQTFAAAAFGPSDAGPIDHVRILAKNMEVWQNTYRSALGFDLARAVGRGFSSQRTRLADGTYVEPVGVADREKLLKARPWIVDFSQEHEGLHYVGVLTASAKGVSDHLQSSGINSTTYSLISSRPGAKPIQIVTPKLRNLPAGAILFLEYPPESLGRRKNLPPAVNTNGTQGILAVWIVVKDLSKASNDAEALGFRFVRSLESAALGATGREVKADQGEIMLLRGTSYLTDPQLDSHAIAARA
jgi:hypothetical protein